MASMQIQGCGGLVVVAGRLRAAHRPTQNAAVCMSDCGIRQTGGSARACSRNVGRRLGAGGKAAAAAAMRTENPALETDSGVVREMFVFPEDSRPAVPHDVFDFDLPVIDMSAFVKLNALRAEMQREHAHGDGDGADEDTRRMRRRRRQEEEMEIYEAERADVLRQLRSACEEYGFFQIVNHGFPMALVDSLRATARNFFRKPMEEKQKAANSRKIIGYISGLQTSKAAGLGSRLWRETFAMRLVLGRGGSKGLLWNHLVQSSSQRAHGDGADVDGDEDRERERVSEEITTYVRGMESLALELLEAVAESLGLPGDAFSQHFREKRDRTCLFTMNNYPICPQPDLTLGVHKHSDPFAINIVQQDDVGGLQLLTKDGRWRGIRPIPGAFVVNVGDLLQVWTNDKVLSSEHRVVANAEKERMSLCFFYNPSRQTCITPAPQFIDHDNPQRYRPFRTCEFQKVVATYGANGRHYILGNFHMQPSHSK